ncbi:MAG: VWA domain-containing protein [Termitinemataceae bacterium]|nr:MAG: VWA domain-containing protein [Termitinemataceae bacterium]
MSAQDLSLGSNDLRITQGSDGGFHLYIRKKAGINSVLLTETTRDPKLQLDNYAYRAASWNPINGNEQRLLDGKLLSTTGQKIFSLIDSTTEFVPSFGEAFHIYIPYILEYGYEWTRHGEVYVGNGTYLNLRAFSLPYADYRGSFKDNPFVLTVEQFPLEGKPADLFMRDTIDAFGETAGATGGTMHYSIGPEDIVQTIGTILSKSRFSTLDIVFCIDTTASMKNDIEAIRANLCAQIAALMREKRNVRIGFVIYRDYYDEYLTRVFDFSDNINIIQRTLNSFRAKGGRDIPEAVHEALYDAATKFKWQAEERQIILIGDAPPHPRARGRISKEMALNAAHRRGVVINSIILPQ